MNRSVCRIAALLLALFLLPVFSVRAQADANDFLPIAENNITRELRKSSQLIETDSGYLRVFYQQSQNRIGVERYNRAFALQDRQWIAMEMQYWGGFFAGQDAYYIVEGQSNTDESNDAEVIRVIRYDKSFRRTGAAAITGTEEFGAQVRYPFDHGCVEMTEVNGKLFIVTGHQGYVDDAYNMGHQGFLMIEVDEATMTGAIVQSDFWHSFAQYVAHDGNDLYVLEQSEGGRCTNLSKFDATDIDPDYFTAVPALRVLEYGGEHTSAWAIPCYASVDDLQLSDTNILCVGTSIDQSNYDAVTDDTPHNIYLTVTPKADFTEESTTVKWLTDYRDGGKCFYGVKLVKINGNRFLLMWEEYEEELRAAEDLSDSLSCYTLHYRFMDGSGNFLGSEFTAAAPIASVHPIWNGTDVVYCASNENSVNFYTINGTTGAFKKVVHRTAGEALTWRIEGDTLYFEGSGPVAVDSEVHYRYPVSSANNWFSYSSSDNVWHALCDPVRKIVFANGVTAVPAEAFRSFVNVQTADFAKSVEFIGTKAFYNVGGRWSVYVRNVNAEIEEDAFWTGYYYYDYSTHAYHVTIYGYEGSTAEAHANESGIHFIPLTGTWIKENGLWYYEREGERCTGWVTADGLRYYLNNQGAMCTGWQRIDGKWYSFQSGGAMRTGWQKIGDPWYYFDDDGVMQTGWQKIDGKWYLFLDSGAMVTGWYKTDGSWYYFGSSGAMATGWQKIGDSWYYFTSGGRMVNGWQRINSKWYYFRPGGAMVTGWQQIGDKWYYFESSGAMVTGWRQINSKWYYFESGGAMVTGTKVINGKTYVFDSNGVWIP